MCVCVHLHCDCWGRKALVKQERAGYEIVPGTLRQFQLRQSSMEFRDIKCRESKLTLAEQYEMQLYNPGYNRRIPYAIRRLQQRHCQVLQQNGSYRKLRSRYSTVHKLIVIRRYKQTTIRERPKRTQQRLVCKERKAWERGGAQQDGTFRQFRVWRWTGLISESLVKSFSLSITRYSYNPCKITGDFEQA